ncbi:conjugal transfer protein TraI, partial [Escherichia sp. 14.0985]
VQVYTDDTGKWLASVAASESRKTAHDVLDVQQDVHATTAQNLWDSARTLNQNALGRALLRETGLPDHSEARFISGS